MTKLDPMKWKSASQNAPHKMTIDTHFNFKSFTELSDKDLKEVNQEFESLGPSEIIQWAADSFSPHLSLTASMTDAVLIDLAMKVDSAIEVIFIDTGYHFKATLETLEKIRIKYGLNLRIMTVPQHDEELWIVDPENCCSALKVGQMDRALNGKLAWLSGLRRDESAQRAGAPIVGRDYRGLVKINPLANWTHNQVETYIKENEIVTNPLLSQGYLSIGCEPCTQPVADGEDPRSGRWQGKDKSECGLHL